MATFTPVDLSQLPAPEVVEVLDFEDILASMLSDLRARMPEFDALVESDPAYKILEVAAYRELLIRQRVNDAAKSVMLAYAGGTDLEQLGALFGVSRLLVDAGDDTAIPPVPPTYEGDAELRRRIQLSLEALAAAGPVKAYQYHALSADPDVLDASAVSVSPGEVIVAVLSRDGNGAASDSLVAAVEAALSPEDVRPLSDYVVVEAAAIQTYSVSATLYFNSGPDRSVVLAQAQKAIEEYTAGQHRIGRDVTLSGIYAALHQPGVSRVSLASPSGTISVDKRSASYCSSITLTDGGVDA
ncbi:baseplate assembly protein [Limimaricola cinnabarinus]|uniref:baseplate assembly protein n=1 Tax=Limimaricola cinnabarinus TaxID=1125964 RepID=UPI002FE2C553